MYPGGSYCLHREGEILWLEFAYLSGEAKLQGHLSLASIHNQSLGVARSPGMQSVLVWWEICRFSVQSEGCKRLEHYSEGGCGVEGVRAGTV